MLGLREVRIKRAVQSRMGSKVLGINWEGITRWPMQCLLGKGKRHEEWAGRINEQQRWGKITKDTQPIQVEIFTAQYYFSWYLRETTSPSISSKPNPELRSQPRQGLRLQSHPKISKPHPANAQRYLPFYQESLPLGIDKEVIEIA